MDAYAHVNNVEMFRLLEEARIEAFWARPAASGAAAADGGTPAAGGAADGGAPAAGRGTPAASGGAGDSVAGGAVRAEGWPTAVLEAGPGAQVATLVARQEIEYLRPLSYRRTPVVVEMWLGNLGGASLEVCYEVRDGSPDEPGSEVYARASTTLVLVDAETGRPRRIAARERAAWEPYVEEPVTFRRRH